MSFINKLVSYVVNNLLVEGLANRCGAAPCVRPGGASRSGAPLQSAALSPATRAAD